MTDTPSGLTSGLHTGSHDLPVSPELTRYMAGNWTASPLPATDRVPAHAATPGAASGSPRTSRASG